MNLKQIEAFVCVVDTGSFSQAARKLFLTQPTVSAHISALEKELNTRLLVRNTKEVHLSQNGEKLYKMARELLDKQNEILREFGVIGTPSNKIITIAASTIPAQYILPDILSEFAKDNPDERFEILEGDNASVISKVLEGTAELGFIGSKDEGIDCKLIPFYTDSLIVMTPNNDHFRAMNVGGEFNAAGFLREPFLIRQQGSGTRKETERALSEIGISTSDMKIVAFMSNQEAIKKAVAQGMGITVLSELAAKDYIESGKALGFKFPGNKAYRSLDILIAKDFKLPPEAQRLVKFIQNKID